MEIGSKIVEWYQENHRILPWRNTKDPYLIWISEIIMQQTRIQQGLPYYLRFVERFPEINDLALAPLEDVLLLWQGLGYYSRARNLHETAKTIKNCYHGIFPDNYDDLLKLKGIGTYTAAAIASFCFGERIPAIDGNVNRVISRIYDLDKPVNQSSGAKLIKKLAFDLLSVNEAGIFNQSMMDFGAIICVPSKPLCHLCPITPNCISFKNQTMGERPVKVKKTKNTPRYFLYVLFKCQKKTLIVQRKKEDIWKGLFEFPLWENKEPINLDSFFISENFKSVLKNGPFNIRMASTMPAHKLSHQTIFSQFIVIDVEKLPVINDSVLVNISDLNHYAFPTLIVNFLSQFKKEIHNFWV